MDIAWFEIPATDIERARRFYETIFACEMQTLHLGGLEMALFPSPGARGALCQHAQFYKPSADAGPLLYFDAAPDLAEVLDRVPAAGGHVTVPKRLISPDQGFMAIFVDTEGNRIALRSKA